LCALLDATFRLSSPTITVKPPTADPVVGEDEKHSTFFQKAFLKLEQME